MSLPEIPRLVVAIQNDEGRNIGFEVRPERSDGNGGFITGRTRPATRDDLLAILSGAEADLAVALAAANARADAADAAAATAHATVEEREAELEALRAELARAKAAVSDDPEQTTA